VFGSQVRSIRVCFGWVLGLSLKYSFVFGYRIIVLDNMKGFKNLGLGELKSYIFKLFRVWFWAKFKILL
jgi:hypothetical protein